MSVYKRGDIYWVKFRVNGQEIRRSAKTSKRREAEAFERKLRERIEDDIKADRLGQSRKRTFAEGLVKWVEQGAPESMYSHIRNVRPYMDTVLITQAVPAASDMKAALLAKGLNPQTINRRLAVVRRVLNLAYSQWNWLTYPLGDKITAMTMSEKEFMRHVYLTPEEFRELCAKIKNEGVNELLIGLAATGMREGEALNLKENSFYSGVVRFNASTKGKKAKTVPVPEYAWPIFERLPFKASYDALRYWFEKARKECGHPEWRIHDLRHSFASWLVQDPNIPLTAVRDILGHSNLSVTSRYAHLRDGALKEAMAAVPNLSVEGTK